jgi:hypothetical protein
MLTKEQIQKNQERFLEVNGKQQMFTQALVQFLGDAYFTAPASTMLSLHNAFPGGLLDHSIKVCRNMIQMNRMLPTDMQVAEKSIYKVAFLAEIGKTFLYRPCLSKWHRENQGKMYEFDESLTSMRVGERSIYYALQFGVELTQEEFQAVLNVDKPLDDLQAKWHSTTLAQLLRQATDLSIAIEKHESETTVERVSTNA